MEIYLALKDLERYCTSNGRVCPLPESWYQLWKLLPRPEKKGDGALAPPEPLILSSWGATSDTEKRERLRDQLLWAVFSGRLGEVDAFLRNLPTDAWLRSAWP